MILACIMAHINVILILWNLNIVSSIPFRWSWPL